MTWCHGVHVFSPDSGVCQYPDHGIQVMVFPPIHMAGMSFLFHGLYNGATAIIMQKFDFAQYLYVNEKYRVGIYFSIQVI